MVSVESAISTDTDVPSADGDCAGSDIESSRDGLTRCHKCASSAKNNRIPGGTGDELPCGDIEDSQCLGIGKGGEMCGADDISQAQAIGWTSCVLHQLLWFEDAAWMVC